MSKVLKGLLVSIVILLLVIGVAFGKSYKISPGALKDKIMGGWAGQVIGCTFGGPTEFRHQSTYIPDYQPIAWPKGIIKWWYDNAPGLYDDIYMDITFVEVIEKEGIDAPGSSFAKAFANAEYPLWHANQMARYNILHGIMPPESGHWLNNPHADDIDFQIEADFAGLMSPGMPNVAAEICDKVGHIMNYGDGWYGGVYVAAMYSLAFVSDDAEYIVKEALKMIPKESQYAKCISDVIKWYHEFPDDWKETWWRVHKKWSEDIGCPDGVFTPFNIDAKINSAWVVLGLLYGKKDFGKTIEIAARCGDDSDCNPATAGGILGTIIGYNNIPEYWKKELKEVEDIDFIYTETSLKELYDISYKHAIANIKRNGGKVKKNKVMISLQDPRPVKLEVGFKDHFPVEKRFLWRKGKGLVLQDTLTVGFYGNGFVINGKAYNDNEDYVFKVEVYIDGKLQEVTELPCNFHDRKNTLFWKYQLPVGKHKVFLKLLNPSDSGKVSLSDIVVYSKKGE